MSDEEFAKEIEKIIDGLRKAIYNMSLRPGSGSKAWGLYRRAFKQVLEKYWKENHGKSTDRT